MHRHLLLTVVSFTLASAAIAQTGSQQAPDWKQTLGGLLNGNQDRDDAVRQAYERGYQRGRNDEARQMQRTRDQRDDDGRGGYRERGGYSR